VAAAALSGSFLAAREDPPRMGGRQEAELNPESEDRDERQNLS
jgi:hypothetical protein